MNPAIARAFEFKPVKIIEEDRKNYGELRYRGVGFIGEAAFALAFTVRDAKGGKQVRAISLRPATDMEIDRYGLKKK